MKKFLFLSLLIFSCMANSFGQDKESDLKRLFKLMHSEKVIDEMMDNMIFALKQQATTMQIQGNDAKERVDEYIDFAMEETKELSKRLVHEEMVALYDKHFTVDEIKDLIQFYESPTGKKMLEQTPELMKELMSVMMIKYMPEFQEKLKRRLEALR